MRIPALPFLFPAALALLALFWGSSCFFSEEGEVEPSAPTLLSLQATVYTYDLINDTLLDSTVLIVPQPEDNLATAEGVALGRKLFHDSSLSDDNTMSCATCHAQAFAFSDHRHIFSTGIHGLRGSLNAPALINLAWDTTSFWNGRAPSLEAQAFEPVVNPIEMATTWPDVVERLRAIPEYPAMFAAAFGSPAIDSVRVVQAIAQYERTLISFNSKYDRVKKGVETFTYEEGQGSLLFFTERGDCFHCHGQPFFTDNQFHNNGLDSDELLQGTGRVQVTGDPAHTGLWNTPTLRNIEFTGPYMHDGRFATLEEVMHFYGNGGVHSSTVDPLIEANADIRRNTGSAHYNPLTEQEMAYLVAFLKTLSDSAFLTDPALGPNFP